MKSTCSSLAALALALSSVGRLQAATYHSVDGAPLRLGAGFDPNEPTRAFLPCVVFDGEWLVDSSKTLADVGPRTKSGAGAPPLKALGADGNTPRPDSAVSTQLTLTLVKDRRSLYETLNIDVNLSARAAFGQGSASTTIDDKFDFSEDDVLWALKASSDFGRYEMKRPRLCPTLKSLSYDKLVQRCGPEIVLQERRAVNIVALFKLHNLSREEQHRLKATLEAEYNGPGFDAKLKSQLELFKRQAAASSTMNVAILATGGRGITLLRDLSSGSLTRTRSDAMKPGDGGGTPHGKAGSEVKSSSEDGDVVDRLQCTEGDALCEVAEVVRTYIKSMGSSAAVPISFTTTPLAAFRPGQSTHADIFVEREFTLGELYLNLRDYDNKLKDTGRSLRGMDGMVPAAYVREGETAVQLYRKQAKTLFDARLARYDALYEQIKKIMSAAAECMATEAQQKDCRTIPKALWIESDPNVFPVYEDKWVPAGTLSSTVQVQRGMKSPVTMFLTPSQDAEIRMTHVHAGGESNSACLYLIWDDDPKQGGLPRDWQNGVANTAVTGRGDGGCYFSLTGDLEKKTRECVQNCGELKKSPAL